MLTNRENSLVMALAFIAILASLFRAERAPIVVMREAGIVQPIPSGDEWRFTSEGFEWRNTI